MKSALNEQDTTFPAAVPATPGDPNDVARSYDDHL
jgi:hypothetical protein